MHLSFNIAITFSLILQPISGLVTLQTIRNLTAVTDECKERIVEGGGVVIDEMARVLGGLGVRGGSSQLVLNGGDEEVEDVSFSFFSGRTTKE
jgi:uncharacterized protein GlcG (DUF336 family)